MGYYTKHIFRIREEHTLDDMVKLLNLIKKHSGYDFRLYPEIDCIDDRTYNDGYGSKFYGSGDIMKGVSSEMSGFHIDVSCHSEDNSDYILECFNGDYNVKLLSHLDDENEWYVLNDGEKSIEYDMPDNEDLDYIDTED